MFLDTIQTPATPEVNVDSKFSFTNFTGTPRTTTAGSTGKPTERQIDFYVDLCTQRGVTPQDVSNMNYVQVATLIAEMKNHYPPSAKQKEMIETKVLNLQSFGVNINVPDMSKLTGGREGTASTLIEKLIEMERVHADKAEPTENQLIFMVNMFLCQEVNFEEYGIERKVDLEDGMWRRLTPEEFASQIKSKMTRREATTFIEKYRGAFHTWKLSRIKPEQQKYIRQLEARMADLSSPSVIEWCVDKDGNLIQIERKVQQKKNAINDNGYIPLDEVELMMFSTEEAGKYIDILKAELERKDLYKFGEINDGSQAGEELRKPLTVAARREDEYQLLKDLMFKLEAIAGYNDEELHESVTMSLIDGEDEANREKVRNFIIDMVEKGDAEFEAIVELCKESEIAQEILTQINE